MQSVQRLIDTFVPENYQLSITQERIERTFQGIVTITGTAKTPGSFSLHSKGLTIESVTLDGKEATFAHREHDELAISHPDLAEGVHNVVIAFSGHITDAMHGLYLCYYKHEGVNKELLATQFESHHAREVFPCVDEPEAKATFDLTLTTETGVTVLGNQPILKQQEESGMLVTTFETTPRMSTYLLAWVTGELHAKTTTTKSGVTVNVWATPSQRPESLDFALNHAVKSIEFFDEYFDTPYPLAKSDHVALPDFSNGAMENWGLITYREAALLADPATTTIASKHFIATVISHELSHQWFGNLVTMKWWNDLWLNESFATLMEYIAVDAIHPEWNAWLDFSSHEAILALRRDAMEGVQSVQTAVHHPDEISSLFDGAIVYAKGARLMRMCQDFIGHTAFQEGLATYFKEFAYENTEADDLWRHLSQASGQDISGIMHTWISESGYPVVHVTPQSLSQERFFIGPHEPSNQLWPIPLGAESTEDMPALLETREVHIEVPDDERLNVRDASHFITHYPPSHLENLLKKLATFDELGRLQLLNEQTLLARGGVISSSQLIDLLEAYAQETAESVWSIMALAFGELKKFVETDQEAEVKLRSFALRLARPEFERLGWEAKENEPESDTKLRSLIIGLMLYGEDEAAEAHCKELFAAGAESIDPELRHLVLSTVIKRTNGLAVIQELLALHHSTHSTDLRDDICAGLTSVRQPDQIALLLETFKNSSIIRKQDLFHWFAYMIRSRYARIATWQWLVENWEWVEANFAGDKSYDYFPQYAASGMVTAEQLEAYKNFFIPKRAVSGLTRVIDLGIKEIEGRVATLEKDSDAVHTRLLAL